METQYNSFYITTLQTQNVEPLSFKSENKEKIMLVLNVTSQYAKYENMPRKT